jgi:capsular exopolysaccharide synthesis family protein
MSFMQGLFNRYLLLVKRWLWVIVLGVVVCGGVTYVISKFTKPTYQATVIFVVNVSTTPGDTTSNIVAVPTYAQLLTNPLVLNPVVAKHRGMTLQQLNEMITVKPETNTQLIELDVQSNDPRLAAQVANEVGQSYLLYANSQLPGTLQMLPAQVPSDPIKPKPLQDAGIGALIGLGLAVTLIVVFEWVEDRLRSPENAQEILAQEILTIIPQFPKQRHFSGKVSAALMEKYRILAASVNTAQAIKPFKVMMVTSALPGEGKSTVAANLAAFLAMTGKMVLLIDANLRHPVLAQRFQIVNSRGFSTVLHETWSSLPAELYGQETDIPTLRVLTSGSILTGSAELLQSLKARQLFNYLQQVPFDYVVVDSPPLLPVADAQFMASLVQAVLLVVDAHKTPRRALLRIKRQLGRIRPRIIGIALNKSPWSDDRDSQQYSGRKTQRPEQSHLLIPPYYSSSLSTMFTLPLTPIPRSLSHPPGIPKSLQRATLRENGEVSPGSNSTSSQDEQANHQEGESKASNNLSQQP